MASEDPAQKGAAAATSDRGRLDDETVIRVSAAKRQWERTFDAIAEPLMIVDESYLIRRANLALADDIGMAVQRVIGARCYDVRAGSGHPFYRRPGRPCDGCPVADAQRTRAPADGEVRSLRGRTYVVRAFPLLDEEVPLTVCGYHDVTDEREMMRQLASTEKLAAIGRLAGGVAHEINNPLAGILAFTQILLREEVPAAELHDYLTEIEKSTLRCKAIVESLLRFSRQAPQPQRQPVSLNEVALEAVRTTAGRGALSRVRIVTDLLKDLPLVLGDAGQLHQVVANLIANAFDSTAGRPGVVELSTGREGADIALRVADRGAGIPEEHMARLFDPFFTTKEEGKGMGLGLAVSYAIVTEHGGRLVARNREGGGAEFAVLLPKPGGASE